MVAEHEINGLFNVPSHVQTPHSITVIHQPAEQLSEAMLQLLHDALDLFDEPFSNEKQHDQRVNTPAPKQPPSPFATPSDPSDTHCFQSITTVSIQADTVVCREQSMPQSASAKAQANAKANANVNSIQDVSIRHRQTQARMTPSTARWRAKSP